MYSLVSIRITKQNTAGSECYCRGAGIVPEGILTTERVWISKEEEMGEGWSPLRDEVIYNRKYRR